MITGRLGIKSSLLILAAKENISYKKKSPHKFRKKCLPLEIK